MVFEAGKRMASLAKSEVMKRSCGLMSECGTARSSTRRLGVAF
jgi:hypothetical protein